MDDRSDELLVLAASRLKGALRRTFQAEVCLELCGGSPRKAEERFGWARNTIAKGMTERELDSDQLAAVKSNNRGKPRSEVANPQLAIDIRLIVEPHTQSDPELKTDRAYTNLSAREVRQALIDRGYQPSEVPSERTLRDILNRMNYRLKRIQKGKPLKKTEHTDAIFENVKAVKAESKADSQTLEISVDTKTKVKLGEFSLGGKNANDLRRRGASSS